MYPSEYDVVMQNFDISKDISTESKQGEGQCWGKGKVERDPKPEG